jgi:nicotinamidase-related amidase
MSLKVHSDVVIVACDVQGSFFSEEGSFAKSSGNPIADAVAVRIRLALSAAEDAGIPCGATVLQLDEADRQSCLLAQYKRPSIFLNRCYSAESVDTTLWFDQKLATAGTYFKNRYNPFLSPEFDAWIARAAPSAAILLGVLTDVCVEELARQFFDRNILPVLVEDCAMSDEISHHFEACNRISRHFGSVSKDYFSAVETASAWAEERRPRKMHDTKELFDN